jgi:hypothetical protein
MKEKSIDVFLSHASPDSAVAQKIVDRLQSAGLVTFSSGGLDPGKETSNGIWQALAESRALIALISPRPTSAMGIVEIGAAAVWNKPIFLLLNGPSSTKLPSALSAYPVYPINRLEDVIQAIRSTLEPLTDKEQRVLKDIYREFCIPVDQLSLSPNVLHEMTKQFNKNAHKQFSEEKLLSEILRMRKKRQLPPLRGAQTPRVKASSLLKRERIRPPKVKPSSLLKRQKIRPPRVKPSSILKQ